MVELEIVAASGQHGDEVEWRPLAHLRVEGNDVEVADERGVLDFSMAVMSLRRGGPVRFEEDREEWARSLPTAFRTGDVVVHVLHDDNPVRDEELPEVEVERHKVRLRERVGQDA